MIPWAQRALKVDIGAPCCDVSQIKRSGAQAPNVANPRKNLSHQLPLRAAIMLGVGKAGQHQCVLNGNSRTDGQRTLAQLRPHSLGSMKHLARGGVENDSRKNAPFIWFRLTLDRSNADRIVGNAVEKIHGAIDWIDDPGDARVTLATAPFLSKKPVLRPSRVQHVVDQLLGVPIHLRDDVVEGGFRIRHFDMSFSPLPHHLARDLGDMHRNVEELVNTHVPRLVATQQELMPTSVSPMRIVIIGAGGVGNALARILATRNFPSHVTISDYDIERAKSAVAWLEQNHPDKAGLFSATQVDASQASSVQLVTEAAQADMVVNAVEPSFVHGVFLGAFDAGAHYLDMAMSLSSPHPTQPFSEPGVKLGDWQFERSKQWEEKGRLALVGMGVEPGLSDVFARYAAEHLFSEVDEFGVRDGANLVVTDDAGNEIFAPSFSIWTTIEECLNPPVIYEKDRGWFTTEPFSEPEIFDFPGGIGPVECVNVEHEEVLLIPRWLDAKRVTFKYGLGKEFIGVLKTLNTLGLDSTSPVSVRSVPGEDGGRQRVSVAPRDLVAAVLPDPATIGPQMTGKTCAGVWVRGKGKDGAPRSSYLYHLADNRWSMENYATQCVVWQTALAPAIALELFATGEWSGAGVLGPEAFDAEPFLKLMARPISEGGYGQEWGIVEKLNDSER